MNRNRKKLAVFATLLGIGTISALFIVFDSKIDIVPAALDLPRATKAYRNAGFWWTMDGFRPKPPISDADNAGALIKKAIAERGKHSFGDLPSVQTIADVPAAEKALAPLSRSLNDAVKASRCPQIDFHRDWDKSFVLQFPELEEEKGMVKALCLRAQCEALTGKTENSDSDIAASLKLSRLVGQEPFLISILVQIACNSIALKTIEFCASTESKDRVALTNLLKTVESTKISPKFREAMKGEAYMELATLRNLSPTEAIRGLRGVPSDTEQPEPLRQSGPLHRSGYPDSLLCRAFLDRVFMIWVEASPHLNKNMDPEAFGKNFDEVSMRSIRDRRVSEMFADVLFPIFSQAGAAVKKREAQELTNRCLLSAMIIHAKTGDFPKDVQHIPGTWIDPFNDKPLQLKSMDGGIRIYSVGPDREDNGGRTAKELNYSGKYDVVSAFPPVKLRRTSSVRD